MDEEQMMAGQEQQPQGGFEICIRVMPDGSMSVYTEPVEAEEGEEPAGEQAGDIKEALTIALDLYKQNQESGNEDAFSEGFGQPKKTMPPVERGMME